MFWVVRVITGAPAGDTRLLVVVVSVGLPNLRSMLSTPAGPYWFTTSLECSSPVELLVTTVVFNRLPYGSYRFVAVVVTLSVGAVAAAADGQRLFVLFTSSG